MGKVKNDVKTAKVSKPAPGKSAGGLKNRFAPFLGNLLRVTLYKPSQGWYARLWTGSGLGLIVGVGIFRLNQILKDTTRIEARYSTLAVVALVFGWLVFRILHYPPFADFLIATEAEMNKVSWTSRDDLYRATMVVLITVLLMSVYLFGVDWLWSSLLQVIGVLKFRAETGMGGG